MLNRYSVTWSTLSLKEEGYNTIDVVNYLKNYDCKILDYNGSKIEITTYKSEMGLKQELRRVFGINFNIK